VVAERVDGPMHHPGPPVGLPPRPAREGRPRMTPCDWGSARR